MADETPGHVDARVLAKLFDCTDRHIRDLSAQGVIPKTERGTYPLGAAVLAYVRHLRGKQKGARSSIAEATAKADLRLKRANAQLAKIELAKKRGEVADLKEVEAEWSTLCAEIKANMRNIPGRVSPLIVGETDIRRIKSEILREIDLVLATLGAPKDGE